MIRHVIQLLTEYGRIARNFLDMVEVVTKDNGNLDLEACWEWKGYIAEDGYGRFSLDGETVLAHRAAIKLLDIERELPEGRKEVVMHDCHNRSCVNIEHLTIGPHSVNVQDSYDEGDKEPKTRGVDRSDGKSEEEIRRMHRLYAIEGWTQSEIADEFGMTQSGVSMILSGECYGYVDVEDIYEEADEE